MNEKKRKDRQRVEAGIGTESSGFTGHRGREAPRDAAFPDLDKYRRHVDHFDLSEHQKTELLRAIWLIMQSFVDRAFGDDPAQQYRGRVDGIVTADEIAGGPVIELQAEKSVSPDHTDLSSAFGDHAGSRGQRKR